ncbi:unnamed protein product [Brassica rapa]|uniref:Uncharacterized protein n=1 Tax=Brassica campestris TaxID=3711 RepID=A0A8D9G7B6_BRACM|nr:unnamed protein product [Brassica rapa]
MALDTASEGNFTTRNPLEVVRLFENLANSSITKNTDSERKKSVASIGKEHMDEVRAKLDMVHELLRKQVCLAEGEVADMEGEENVNFIGGIGFQKFGNQGGNRNFFGNVMLYLNKFSSQIIHAQRDIDKITNEIFLQANSFSIDRLRGPWNNGKNPVELLPYTAAELIHKTIESMHEELIELSAYAYDNIGWHQVSIDNVQDRLHNISNVLKKMDDKWTRNDEATRSFIESWSKMCRDDVDACFPTSSLGHTRTHTDSHGHTLTHTAYERPMCADGHTRTHTDSHGRPVCAGGHQRTSCVY